jgi:hypothetical protein
MMVMVTMMLLPPPPRERWLTHLRAHLEPPPRELSTLLTLHQTFLSELQEADNSFTESFLSFIPFMKVPSSCSHATPPSPSSLTWRRLLLLFSARRCRE